MKIRLWIEGISEATCKIGYIIPKFVQAVRGDRKLHTAALVNTDRTECWGIGAGRQKCAVEPAKNNNISTPMQVSRLSCQISKTFPCWRVTSKYITGKIFLVIQFIHPR
jgi:hypothetical protein